VGASRTLIILAGGQSRRMGRDKAHLPTGAGTLLERIVDRLSSVVDQVMVAGGPPLSIPEVRWVPDARPSAGPLAGMAAGLAALSSDLAWIVACDLPDVEPRLGELLFASASDVDAVVPRVGGKPECLCAVYRASLAGRIVTMLDDGERRVTALLDGIRVRYVEAAELRRVDPDLRSFRNLNTEDEYQDWVTSRR